MNEQHMHKQHMHSQRRFKQHRLRRRADRAIKRRPPWREYTLTFVVLILVVISMYIGVIEIKITDTISFLLLPLIYSLVMGLALYLAKPFKYIDEEQAKVAEGVMVLLIGVLICKLAISSGQSIGIIFQVGPALVLQLLGDLGTLIALPVALLLGFRREVIGMASSICREPNLGIIYQFLIKHVCFTHTIPSICLCNGIRYRKCKYECRCISSIGSYEPGHSYPTRSFCRMQ